MVAFTRPALTRDLASAIALALVTALVLLPRTVTAADELDPVDPEPWNTGWAFYIDNDALVVGRDQQYTGGFALTLSGRRAAEYPWSLNPALQWVNDRIGLSGLGAGERWLQRHSLHVGIAGFTPEDIGEPDPIPDDRPYASLAFLSNTHQRVLLREHVVYQSSLIVGLLGTDIGRGIQNTLHELGNHEKARGWDNQISDGGELTGSYFATRYDTIALHRANGFGDYQVQTGIGASVGFATQVGVGISARWGRYQTPWWEFVPDYAEYIGLGTPLSSRSSGGEDDLFAWGGINLRYSLYNALLEGQFRDSEVTHDRDDLRSALAEVSLGLTVGLDDGMHFTFAVRARTPELRDADADHPIWASLVLTRNY